MRNMTLIFTVLLTYSLSVFSANETKVEIQKFKKAANQKIELMEEKLDVIKDKIANKSGEAKEILSDKYEELKEMTIDFKDKVTSTNFSTKDKWDDLKDNIEDYADKIESKFDELI